MNTVEAVFKKSVTEAEYDEIARQAQFRKCRRCSASVHISQAIACADGFYCSKRCVDIVERDNAPMIKPQSKRQLIDGWDV